MIMTMSEAITVDEFPFVAELPKREKSALQTTLEELDRYVKYQQEHGPIMPVKFAARVLCVSRVRVHELMEKGKLERVEFNGHPFVTHASVVKYAKAEKDKGGRPPGPGKKLSYFGKMKLAVQLGADIGEAVIPD